MVGIFPVVLISWLAKPSGFIVRQLKPLPDKDYINTNLTIYHKIPVAQSSALPVCEADDGALPPHSSPVNSTEFNRESSRGLKIEKPKVQRSLNCSCLAEICNGKHTGFLKEKPKRGNEVKNKTDISRIWGRPIWRVLGNYTPNKCQIDSDNEAPDNS